MTVVLYGKSRIGPGKGVEKRKIYLDDTSFTPAGVVVTGLSDNADYNDTFAIQVTLLQPGAFQVNVRRVDADAYWKQDLWISYIAWGDK